MAQVAYWEFPHKTGSGRAEASVIASPLEYLRSPPIRTAWYLAQKAVVMIDSIEFRGQVVWPEPDTV
jgi:hypothetical protein